MRIQIVLMAILVVAVSAPGAQYQRNDRGPVQPRTGRFGDPTDTARHLQGFVYGVVNKVSPSEIVCDKTIFGDGQTFKLDKKTKYVHDGKPASLDVLKAGEQVWVKPKKDKKTGEMTAQSVMTGVPPVEAK